jgi:ABC-type branched-subunit amino acid transport system permease subunit
MTTATAAMKPSRSPRTRLRDFFERHRSISILTGMAIITPILPFVATLPPFNGFNAQSVWIDAFATAGIYVLLALGLNVVVGLAGLLDLGYAAFFAIGAYTYAYGSSGFTDLHIPFWPMLLIGAFVAAFSASCSSRCSSSSHAPVWVARCARRRRTAKRRS